MLTTASQIFDGGYLALVRHPAHTTRGDMEVEKDSNQP